jgi:hypothetical protein
MKPYFIVYEEEHSFGDTDGLQTMRSHNTRPKTPTGGRVKRTFNFRASTELNVISMLVIHID